jgi:hypothetical protein
MRTSLLIAALTILSTLAGCSSGPTPFLVLQYPVDIQASSKDIAFGGRTTRLIYVANRKGGTVSVIAQDNEALADTDAGDPYDNSPIIVGGEPVALLVQDRDPAPRIFVADARHNELWAFDAVPPADPNFNELKHEPVDLGPTAVGRASRALFQDAGRRSTPDLARISVDPAIAKNEQWMVQFGDGDNRYSVTGSKSGLQTARASENIAFATADGGVAFTVNAGGEPTTDADTFRFGMIVGKPLSLTGRPVDMKGDGSRIFIVMTNPASVAVFDLQSLAITSDTPLPGGVGVDPMPGRSALLNGHLYVPDGAGNILFDFNTTDLTLATWATDVPAFSAAADGASSTLYLFSAGTRLMELFDLNTHSRIAPLIRLSNIGMTLAPYTFDGKPFGLIPTASGNIELLDLAAQTRVDTNISSRVPQSEAFSATFYDTGVSSAPNLVAINTLDGATRTERWQLVYEGAIPETSLDATVAADVVSAPAGTFTDAGIQAGDHVVLDPYGSPEEIAVAQVTDQQNLVLASTPSHQGAVRIEIRVTGTYLAIGSESPPQKNRALEGTPYTSDDGAISLTIRPSRSAPTTRDDYFTFLTTDGIDPILNSSSRLSIAAAVLVRPGDTQPTAYVANAGSDSVSVVHLGQVNPVVRRIIQ